MRRNITVRKYSCLVLVFALIAFLGCAPLVKTDMDCYLQNQEYYKGKYVVFKTDLENILERYELYEGKEVELTAPVTYVGKSGFSRWYLTLEEDGKKISCYENDYRHYPRWEVLYILRKAKNEGGEVTVKGKLRPDGIELNQLIYKKYILNTNYPPNERYFDWMASQPYFNYHYDLYYPRFYPRRR